MEKFERELNSERLSKKEISLGGKKQQLYYHEDLLVRLVLVLFTTYYFEVLVGQIKQIILFPIKYLILFPINSPVGKHFQQRKHQMKPIH